MTGTGTPLSKRRREHPTGARHRALPGRAAEIDRSTRASLTFPSGPMVASTMTTPCTRADWAMLGYTGFTFLIFVGGRYCRHAHRRNRRRWRWRSLGQSLPRRRRRRRQAPPPSTPPATPPSGASIPVSGLISDGRLDRRGGGISCPGSASGPRPQGAAAVAAAAVAAAGPRRTPSSRAASAGCQPPSGG